jgi:hypothetical protein
VESTSNNETFSVNMRAIDKQINIGMDMLNSNYNLREMDCGEFSNLQIQSISYNVKQYEIGGVGNLLVMESKDSPKLQMLSFVITPYYKSLPLFSNDYIYVQQKRSFLIEYYDLVKEKNSLYKSYMDKFQNIKDKYAALPDMELKECWYDSLKTVCTAKKISALQDDAILSAFTENVNLFIDMEHSSECLSENDMAIKWRITQDYTDRLVDSGGVSTNVFKNTLGADATKAFFNDVFFGVKKFAVKRSD